MILDGERSNRARGDKAGALTTGSKVGNHMPEDGGREQ